MSVYVYIIVDKMATFVDSKRIMKASRVALSDEVKNRLDVDEGDTVFFIEENGRIYLKKAEA